MSTNRTTDVQITRVKEEHTHIFWVPFSPISDPNSVTSNCLFKQCMWKHYP